MLSANVPEVESSFGLDRRSLALLRIGIGLILVYDWLTRFLNFKAHYTEQGVLPLRIFLQQSSSLGSPWSVFYLNDSPWYVATLFLLGIVASLALLLGYRVRWFGWLAWLLLLGLHRRNPLLLHKGDTYLLLLLFWGNFMSWDRSFGLDAARDSEKEQPKPTGHFSMATVAYLLQICFVYWFTALKRTSPAWQVDGNALYNSLQLEPLLRGVADGLLGLGPFWLQLLSFSVLAFEICGPFLLLIPYWRCRLLSVILVASFHFGTLVSMDLGSFPWICMVAVLGVLPEQFWQRMRLGRAISLALVRGSVWLCVRQPQWMREFRPPTLCLPRPWHQNLVPGLALLLSVGYLIGNLLGRPLERPDMTVSWTLGLGQSWEMFSPEPPRIFGWQSVEARTRSGSVFDLITRRPYGKGSYRDEDRNPFGYRWREYRNMVALGKFGANANLYMDYLVQRWNHDYPQDPIVECEYLWHSRVTQPDYLLSEEARAVVARYPR